MSKLVKFDHNPTSQEVFDAVMERLYNGEGPAMDDTGACRYLDPVTGKRCAVGIFIEYPFKMEDLKVSAAYNLITQGNFGVSESERDLFGFHLTLLMNLQDAHDNKMNWDGNQFVAHSFLENIAREFELNFKLPSQDESGQVVQ